jgi:SAM-dependent methyltransferase
VPPTPQTEPSAPPDDLIDADALAERYTVEELIEGADRYFARLVDWDYHLAKPLTTPGETPVLLAHFAASLSALRLTPGMTVLDFGPGSCWTTRWLTQIGCAAIACDASAHALEIGRELFRRLPVIGAQPEPRFLLFDGHHVDLPDESVDRVLCIDAFHHVPNRPPVLAELYRVLRPGGRAVFAEGGPNHSRYPQSQAEMRDHVVVERDIRVDVFDAEARAAGFGETTVGIYAGVPFLVPADRYVAELAGDATAGAAARHFHENHTLLVLEKHGFEERTSAGTEGLAAAIEVTERDGDRLRVRVTNTGACTWLGPDRVVGLVQLGVQLVDATGRVVDRDHLRVPLTDDPFTRFPPGAVVDLDVTLPEAAPGASWRLDLVSEGVAWFADLGSPTLPVPR